MSRWARRFGALEERPFRLLWLPRTTSKVGDAVSGIAIAFAVLSVSDSAAALGLVLAAFTLARVVFILAGGVWSDRISRRRVMIACDLIRGGAQAVVAALLLTGSAEIWRSSRSRAPASRFAVDAATFLVSAAFLAALRVEGRARAAERQSFLADLAHGCSSSTCPGRRSPA